MSEASVPATRRPVEAKVQAATAGAGLGAAVAAAAVWAVDTYWWTPGVAGDLPAPLAGLVLATVAAGTAWAAGWKARHTARPDLEPAAGAEPAR